MYVHHLGGAICIPEKEEPIVRSKTGSPGSKRCGRRVRSAEMDWHGCVEACTDFTW